jgi:precorrin-4 methylase
VWGSEFRKLMLSPSEVAFGPDFPARMVHEVSWTEELESQQRLTQLTQHATHESKTKYTLLYAKGHSAQPDMLWRTHHTKSDPKSMRVMPLCLWGV